jgi:hypothetical protein
MRGEILTPEHSSLGLGSWFLLLLSALLSSFPFGKNLYSTLYILNFKIF